MEAQQNNGASFAPPVYSQELYKSPNGSYKLLLNVCNFNGYVRVGILKQIWCESVHDYVHAAKGHCYFPAEVCDALKKYLPAAKAQSERLQKQEEARGQDGYTKPLPDSSVGRLGGFRAPGLHAKRVGAPAQPFAFPAGRYTDAYNGSRKRFCGKRWNDEYKTERSDEEETNAVEQGNSKKRLAIVEEANRGEADEGYGSQDRKAHEAASTSRD